jgi:anti-anti-sigma factor
MEMQEQNLGAVTVIKPVGALVGEDAGYFRTRTLALASKHLGRIVVDASGIPFVDSSGAEALVDVTEELALGGRALKLCATNPMLKEVLELTGWSDAFEFFAEVQAGVRSFL